MYRLKDFRKDFGLKQSDLANMFSCVQGNISEIERNGKDLEDYQLAVLIKEYGEEIVKKYMSNEKIVNNFGSIGGNNRSTYNNVGNTSNEDTEFLKQKIELLELRLKEKDDIIQAKNETIETKNEIIESLKNKLKD